MPSVLHGVDAERAEVDSLLSSKRFARTNNFGRFLCFVCERYFEGDAADIKEYTIAVQALRRPPDFDPQADCIVRVTAHNLRKQLEIYYGGEGAHHPVHVHLPPGHYVPQFIHREESAAPAPALYSSPANELSFPPQPAGNNGAPTGSVPDEPIKDFISRSGSTNFGWKLQNRAVVILSMLLICGFAAFAFYRWTRRSPSKSARQGEAIAAPLNVPGQVMHTLVGDERPSFIDRAGIAWQPDQFCSGGESFSLTGHAILGTNDAQIFSAGRRGIFKCSYPVPPGSYEVHLLFAETSGLQENTRHVAFSINGGPANNLDVVDDAGGDDIATTKLYTDVGPESDGKIHIEFTTPDSFVNAIEILPGISHQMLPVRILAGPSSFRDGAGNLWLPDRYYLGGRRSLYGGELTQVSDSGLYEWHRFGHFRYIIPVATGAKYTLKLYFLEHWFGLQSGGIGGQGSRVFDVSCNGSALLKDFDVYREAGSNPLVKTFPHIEPTAQGKIELAFTPVVNYPSICAIEITSE